MAYGALYATLVGTAEMQQLFVNSWHFQYQVTCQQILWLDIINNNNIAAIPLLTTRSGRGTGTALVGHFACTGQELSLLGCRYTRITSCSYTSFAGVQCLGKSL